MSACYLGNSFDIHGGGKDLIFPHHENELAQSRAACSESNVNCWMHNGFVNRDNEKMSKSLQNFFTIRDVIEKYHPLALRLFLMDTHYRSDVNFSDKLLEISSNTLFYIYQTLHDCEVAMLPFEEDELSGQAPEKIQQLIEKFHVSFLASMSDDLHTKTVLNNLSDPLKAINNNLTDFNKLLHGKKKLQKQQQKKQEEQKEQLRNALCALKKEVNNVLSILGLMSCSACSEVLRQLKDKALERAGLTGENVIDIINERALARKNKEYAKSDQLRADLLAKGIALMDEPSGTIWRPREEQPDNN